MGTESEKFKNKLGEKDEKEDDYSSVSEHFINFPFSEKDESTVTEGKQI